LAQLSSISIGAPTILTGANDGGKTSLLRMLEFLLGGDSPSVDDYTRVADASQVEQCVATGIFELSDRDREQLSLDQDVSTVSIRRIAERSGSTRYELLIGVPAEHLLRGVLDTLPLEDLKSRTEALRLSCPGHKGKKETFLAALREAAAKSDRVEVWDRVEDRTIGPVLPRHVAFSSTREPDPRSDIRQALRARYDMLAADEERLKPVRDLETEFRQDLASAAAELGSHIRLRCPELSQVEIAPEVSFSSGLKGVEIVTGNNAVGGVSLDASGSGRKRRITLAVWEWTQKLLARQEPFDRSVVIAYDEPDTHLDYQHQRELVTLIREQASTPGIQVLVATHALNLIDQIDIADVIHLTLDDKGHSEVNQLLEDDHEAINQYLRNVASAMGLRNSALLHERAFLVVEGPTELYGIPPLFRLATGMTLQSAGLGLIVGDGNDGALKLARSLVKHQRPVYVLVDNDTFKNPASRRAWSDKKLGQYGITADRIFRLGNPAELEDLFSDDQWSSCANRHWARDCGDGWTNASFAQLRAPAGAKFSDRLYRIVREESTEAPSSKAELLATLVGDMADRDEIPDALRKVLLEIGSKAVAT
jgi:putative ATP-dependent endonuclease of the OLD family